MRGELRDDLRDYRGKARDYKALDLPLSKAVTAAGDGRPDAAIESVPG